MWNINMWRCSNSFFCTLSPSLIKSSRVAGYLGNRTQVAVLVDAVRREDGFIVKVLFSDTNPAQLVTDYFYLFFGTLHKEDAYLAGDTIKRCINCRVQQFSLSCWTEFMSAFIASTHTMLLSLRLVMDFSPRKNLLIDRKRNRTDNYDKSMKEIKQGLVRWYTHGDVWMVSGKVIL